MNLGGEKRRFLCYNRPCFQYALKEGRPVQENNWEKTLEQLKQELKETGDAARLGRLEQLEREFQQALSERVDIREFCENSGQALCITDGQGHPGML